MKLTELLLTVLKKKTIPLESYDSTSEAGLFSHLENEKGILFCRINGKGYKIEITKDEAYNEK
ncbi:MAG TPA: hypothetical protein HA341_01395 [Halobacteria archaeon]|nr:hypothetical protein [Halobacteria archaeon]